MTKPANKRARRGRHRDQDKPRQPNQRVQANYAANREDMRAVVIQQRVTKLGLTEEQAKDPYSASVVGRMLKKEKITPNEHTALANFQQTRHLYCRVMGVPAEPMRAIPMDPDMLVFRGAQDDRDDLDGVAVKRNFNDALSSLAMAHPLAAKAVTDAVWRNIEPEPIAFHCGVQALRQHFRYPDDRKRDE